MPSSSSIPLTSTPSLAANVEPQQQTRGGTSAISPSGMPLHDRPALPLPRPTSPLRITAVPRQEAERPLPPPMSSHQLSVHVDAIKFAASGLLSLWRQSRQTALETVNASLRQANQPEVELDSIVSAHFDEFDRHRYQQRRETLTQALSAFHAALWQTPVDWGTACERFAWLPREVCQAFQDTVSPPAMSGLTAWPPRLGDPGVLLHGLTQQRTQELPPPESLRQGVPHAWIQRDWGGGVVSFTPKLLDFARQEKDWPRDELDALLDAAMQALHDCGGDVSWAQGEEGGHFFQFDRDGQQAQVTVGFQADGILKRFKLERAGREFVYDAAVLKIEQEILALIETGHERDPLDVDDQSAQEQQLTVRALEDKDKRLREKMGFGAEYEVHNLETLTAELDFKDKGEASAAASKPSSPAPESRPNSPLTPVSTAARMELRLQTQEKTTASANASSLPPPKLLSYPAQARIERDGLLALAQAFRALFPEEKAKNGKKTSTASTDDAAYQGGSGGAAKAVALPPFVRKFLEHVLDGEGEAEDAAYPALRTFEAELPLSYPKLPEKIRKNYAECLADAGNGRTRVKLLAVNDDRLEERFVKVLPYSAANREALREAIDHKTLPQPIDIPDAATINAALQTLFKDENGQDLPLAPLDRLLALLQGPRHLQQFTKFMCGELTADGTIQVDGNEIKFGDEDRAIADAFVAWRRNAQGQVVAGRLLAQVRSGQADLDNVGKHRIEHSFAALVKAEPGLAFLEGESNGANNKLDKLKALCAARLEAAGVDHQRMLMEKQKRQTDDVLRLRDIDTHTGACAGVNLKPATCSALTALKTALLRGGKMEQDALLGYTELRGVQKAVVNHYERLERLRLRHVIGPVEHPGRLPDAARINRALCDGIPGSVAHARLKRVVARLQMLEPHYGLDKKAIEQLEVREDDNGKRYLADENGAPIPIPGRDAMVEGYADDWRLIFEPWLNDPDTSLGKIKLPLKKIVSESITTAIDTLPGLEYLHGTTPYVAFQALAAATLGKADMTLSRMTALEKNQQGDLTLRCKDIVVDANGVVTVEGAANLDADGQAVLRAYKAYLKARGKTDDMTLFSFQGGGEFLVKKAIEGHYNRIQSAMINAAAKNLGASQPASTGSSR